MTKLAVASQNESHSHHSHVKHFSVSSRWIYQDDNRLDATTYSAGAFQALSAIERCRFHKRPFGSLCGTIWHPVQNQARSNFKRIYTAQEHGVPFVSSRDMFFYPLQPQRFLARRMPKLGDLMVPEGWLLVSRSGTVGNVLYVGRTLSRCAISDHTIRVEPKNAPSGYLYAFLSSAYGQPLIAKGIYGATVDEVEPKHLAVIPVPLADETAQLRIHKKVMHAYALRDDGNDLYQEAVADLYCVLGVSSFREDDVQYFGARRPPRAFSVSSSDLADRLDASHHVPLAPSAVAKLKTGKFPLVQLGNRVDDVYVAPRFARVYVEQEYGTPLLQGSHVPAMRPSDLKYISNHMTVKMERWIIHKGMVLVTCSGTVGRTAVVSAAQDGWAASQHILRITPKTDVIHPGFLCLFLATPYGQHQLNSKIYGGVVDELTSEDTEIIWIPDVPYEVQEPIGNKILQVYEKRDQANRVEVEAISDMETIIHGNSMGLVCLS
jgi:type I restriction enzyme S subunit